MHEDIEAHEHGVVVRLLMMVAVTTVISSLSVVGAFVQPDGQVAGTVRDTTGSRLPGVAVDLTSSASGETVQSTKTDANGQYRISRIPTGEFSITFSLSGFSTERREGLQLGPGWTMPVHVRLHAESEGQPIVRAGDSASVSGIVVDDREVGCAGATLTLTGPEKHTATSETGGAFSFPKLPAGDYELRAALDGFATTVRKVRIFGGTRTLRVELSLGSNVFQP